MNEGLGPVLGYCFPVKAKVFVQRNGLRLINEKGVQIKLKLIVLRKGVK